MEHSDVNNQLMECAPVTLALREGGTIREEVINVYHLSFIDMLPMLAEIGKMARRKHAKGYAPIAGTQMSYPRVDGWRQVRRTPFLPTSRP